MPQQINLRNPIFLTQKHYFSASAMAASLVFFVLLGLLFAGYWNWTLETLNAGYVKSVANNQREIDRLQAALVLERANAGAAEPAMVQELESRKTELQRRELLLMELKRGLMREGYGHAARLQLLARTIPPQAWVTEIRADDLRLELGGYTLEPAALNGWVARLADSPLMEGQQLALVKVERVPADLLAAKPGLAALRSSTVWSYNLVTALAASEASRRKP
jgi:Tfp pilus assembly protein PilN